MARISMKDRTLDVKIVYYGPALSGKTTNLEVIHRLTDPGDKTRLVSLKTDGDRTLFFDLLPFDLGEILGLAVKLKLYTVPGQVQYNTTRKLVLNGADGIVFIADSHPDQLEDNKRSLRHLHVNLRANRLEPDTIPLVYQWNKRDLQQAVACDVLRAELVSRDLPCLEAVATCGKGVMETLASICSAAVVDILKRNRLLRQVSDRLKVERHVQGALLAFKPSAEAERMLYEVSRGKTPAQSAASNDETGGFDTGKILEIDDLLIESIRTNLAVSEKATLLDSVENDLSDLVEVVRSLMASSRKMLEIQDPEELVGWTVKTAMEISGADVGSLLLHREGASILDEAAVLGARRDPLNSIEDLDGKTLAFKLINRNENFVTNCFEADVLQDRYFRQTEGITGVALIPLRTNSLFIGGLVLYKCRPGALFAKNTSMVLSILAGQATGSIVSILLSKRSAPAAGAPLQHSPERCSNLSADAALRDKWLEKTAAETGKAVTLIEQGIEELAATGASPAQQIQRGVQHLKAIIRAIHKKNWQSPPAQPPSP